MRREFRFVDGTSSKFWAIEVVGTSFTVQFGRIGSAGQSQSKSFGSEDAAHKAAAQLIGEKTKKGYVEVGAAATDEAARPSQASAEPAPAPPQSVSIVPPAATPVALPAEVPQVSTPSALPAAPPGPTPAALPAAVLEELRNAFPPARIDLDPADWMMAPGNRRPRLTRPVPAPFDRGAALERLGKVSGGRILNWNSAGIPACMTRAEAFFWLNAMAIAGEGIPVDRARDQMALQPPTTVPTFDDVCGVFENARKVRQLEMMRVLSHLLDFDETLKLLLESDLVYQGGRFQYSGGTVPWDLQTIVNDGLRRFFFPYFTEPEMSRLRSIVAPMVAGATWPTDFYTRPSPVFALAAMCHCTEALLPLIEALPDDRYTESGWDHSTYHQPQLLVLGLGDARLTDMHMRRLKLPLSREEYLRGWLAVTECDGLDYAKDCVMAVTSKEECEKLLQILALVKAPQAALPMLELKASSKAPWVARQWFQENTEHAVVGLVDTASGRGRLADAAIEFLNEVKRSGGEALIRVVVGEGGYERVRRDVLDKTEKVYPPLEPSPAWLVVGRAPKLPAWLNIEELPPIVVDAHRLTSAQAGAVIAAVQQATLPTRGPLLDALRTHASHESLDGFAWKLFQTWLTEGAPSKDKWAMTAVGLLGGDALALKLTPLVRAWPGESQHQRAVHGLDCLMTIGTDTALMCLNGIAQKLPFKALKARAAECMENIARQRGMTRAELEDRIVPDCDLDARGTRVFDFGPRQFTFLLGPEMKPMVKDPDGKLKTDLPAPGTRDDADKAREAVEAWKLLKKQVREVAKLQAERLEQAMVTGRRWRVDEFVSLLVRHPLMTHLVRLVVWGTYAADGRLTGTFRVTEELDFSDASDDPITLDEGHAVGVVHPLHLTDEVKSRWGELLTDYRLIPPFPQLGRPTFRLEPGEAEQKEITRFSARKVPATSLVGTLERLSWVRGMPQDAGIFYEHSKQFPGANVTAVVAYDGVPVGSMEGWDDQAIERVFFVAGLYAPEMYPEHKNATRLGRVDAVAMSEVLKDMTLIASKAV